MVDLLDTQRSLDWLEQHFHPQGMCCAQCGASRDEARLFRINRGSRLPVYRCQHCGGIYNVYSQTVFAGSQLTAPPVVLLLQGVLQGKPSRQWGRELNLTEVTVLLWRHRLRIGTEANPGQRDLFADSFLSHHKVHSEYTPLIFDQQIEQRIFRGSTA